MKIVHGWAFPDSDELMAREIGRDGTYQLDHLRAALRYVTDYGCALDGGAHVGTWSKVMAGLFDRVVAVEPSVDTFECLTLNMMQFRCFNVEPMNVAIGASAGRATMRLDAVNTARANTGARFAASGGTIHVETIDSWQLDRVGLLKLDIEGSEPLALEGARETLQRCRPVILCENKRLWAKHFGLPDSAVVDVLAEHHYRLVETIGADQIWGPA